MTTAGENNIKTANGNQEENEEELEFNRRNEELERELAIEAQDSFEQENGGSPTYLYDQEQRSGGKI